MSSKGGRTLRVAVVHRRLPHYRFPIYDGISEQSPDIDLAVYCGHDSDDPNLSGMSRNTAVATYLRRVRTYQIGGGTKVYLQPAVLWRLLRHPPDVAVFEARLLLLTSLPILIWRRLRGQRSIIWLKGWPTAKGEGRLSRMIRSSYLSLGHHYVVYGRTSVARLVHYGVDENRITVAQNTVDVSALLSLTPPARGADSPAVQAVLDEKRPFVLNIGRLTRAKAVSDLVEAFAIVRRDPELAGTALVVAGRGSELDRLRALAEHLGLGGSIVFAGAVSEHDAELLYRTAACCVLPGAVGLSLNQALAAGLPVICADEYGPDSELLVHEQNGLRFAKADVPALAAAIRRVLLDRELAERLGASARASISSSATMENLVARLLEAFRRAAPSSP